MIPAGLDYILNKNLIEDERIEFKKSWNLEPIMHTMCAFANDISNLSGGYIIIGMKDDGNIEGVDRKSVDHLNHEVINICNMIEPRCNAYTEYYEIEEKGLYVIWVPGGHERPYRCPVTIKGEKTYYIRRISSTVKANASEIKELMEISNRTPFDDRINQSATIRDIDPLLVKRFLGMIGSMLYETSETIKFEELLKRMNLVGKMSETIKPLNVALMFFNEHPDDFFRCAYIDIVNKPDPTGEGMTETRITGPLDRQIVECVSYIKNQIIKETVHKFNDRPESSRVFNYPLKAVEEAISNAIYHKDYNVSEPVTVTIMPDRIEITSIPGPFRSISDNDLKTCHLVSRTSRNRRIGEFLKEMKLVEGRNTGIPTMIRSMSDNCSEIPKFETDDGRTYMTVTLKINNVFLKSTKSTRKSNLSREEKRLKIIDILDRKECSTREIANGLGYEKIIPALKEIIYEMISDGTIEYTEKNLNSSKQKLRLRH